MPTTERRIHPETAQRALVHFLFDLQLLHDHEIPSAVTKRDVIGTCLLNLDVVRRAICQDTYPDPKGLAVRNA